MRNVAGPCSRMRNVEPDALARVRHYAKLLAEQRAAQQPDRREVPAGAASPGLCRGRPGRRNDGAWLP